MYVLGVEGSEKKCVPPRIISGTALSRAGYGTPQDDRGKPTTDREGISNSP